MVMMMMMMVMVDRTDQVLHSSEMHGVTPITWKAISIQADNVLHCRTGGRCPRIYIMYRRLPRSQGVEVAESHERVLLPHETKPTTADGVEVWEAQMVCQEL